MKNHTYAKIAAAFMSIILLSAASAGCKRPAADPASTAAATGTVKATSSATADIIKTPEITQPVQTEAPAYTHNEVIWTVEQTAHDQTPDVSVNPTASPAVITASPTSPKYPVPLPTPNEQGYTVYFASHASYSGESGVYSIFKSGTAFFVVITSNMPNDFTSMKIFVYKLSTTGETLQNKITVEATQKNWTRQYFGLTISEFGSYRIAFVKNDTEQFATSNVGITW